MPSGWNSVQWFVGTLLCEQLFGIVDDPIRITTAVWVCGCACVEIPVNALLSLFCCRAETERGLNRKHIIEGNFPSLSLSLSSLPSALSFVSPHHSQARCSWLISHFYPFSSLPFLHWSCRLWFCILLNLTVAFTTGALNQNSCLCVCPWIHDTSRTEILILLAKWGHFLCSGAIWACQIQRTIWGYCYCLGVNRDAKVRVKSSVGYYVDESLHKDRDTGCLCVSTFQDQRSTNASSASLY